MNRPTEAIETLRGYASKFTNPQFIVKFPIANAANDVLAYLDEMERTLPPMNSQLENAARNLAGAFWRLHEYGYMGPYNDDEQEQFEHWRDIGVEAEKTIRRLLKSNQSKKE